MPHDSNPYEKGYHEEVSYISQQDRHCCRPGAGLMSSFPISTWLGRTETDLSRVTNWKECLPTPGSGDGLAMVLYETIRSLTHRWNLFRTRFRILWIGLRKAFCRPWEEEFTRGKSKKHQGPQGQQWLAAASCIHDIDSPSAVGVGAYFKLPLTPKLVTVMEPAAT